MKTLYNIFEEVLDSKYRPTSLDEALLSVDDIDNSLGSASAEDFVSSHTPSGEKKPTFSVKNDTLVFGKRTVFRDIDEWDCFPISQAGALYIEDSDIDSLDGVFANKAKVKELYISNCPNLKSLDGLPDKLDVLELSVLPNLEPFHTFKCPTVKNKLTIFRCRNKRPKESYIAQLFGSPEEVNV